MTVDRVVNEETQSTVSLEQRIVNAVAPGAVIAGIMSEARADAVHDYNTAVAKDFNEAAADKGKWAVRTVELGTSLIPPRVPVVGEVVNWLAEDITESVEKDVTDIKEDGSRDYIQARAAAIDSAKEAVPTDCDHPFRPRCGNRHASPGGSSCPGGKQSQ